MWKKSLAFTLGEILIAMTIIGAISAMVLPRIIIGQKSNKAYSQFNTAYSLLSDAITSMDANNVSLKPSNYGSAIDFYNVLKTYQKVTHDCGSDDLCSPKPVYMDIDNNGAFIVNNGMLFIVERAISEDGIKINNLSGYGNLKLIPLLAEARQTNLLIDDDIENQEETETVENIIVTIDINGNQKKPNKRGYDLFSFQLIDGDIIPVGAEESFTQIECNREGTTTEAMACTQNAATNADYFKNLYNNL